MRLLLGSHIVVKIKYVFQRDDAVYWQRRIPKALEHRYASSAPLKVRIHSTDPKVIATKVERLNRQHEALWAAMRKDPTLEPIAAHVAAKKLLEGHGVQAVGEEGQGAAVDAFMDHLDRKRAEYADSHLEPEEAYYSAPSSAYLTKAEKAAADLLRNGPQFLVSDALEVYLEEHPKRDVATFVTYSRRAFEKLMQAVGDKAFKDFSRQDAKTFRDWMIAQGSKTTTARRILNVVKAVFTSAIVEKQLNIPNPFDKLRIAGLGDDAEERECLTPGELSHLRELCRSRDDDMRWISALQLDTGARVGEIVGLALGDIILAGEVPHINITPHPWRSLKTSNIKRKVPLVGEALWAAQRVVQEAKPGQVQAFPRYIKDGVCKVDSASAGLNKWMKLSGIPKTTHCLRHTMRDRLRNSGAPRDIQDWVGGWGKNTSADNYGDGYALGVMRKALLRACETVSPGPEALDAVAA